eukprot:689007-Rhodomonas_salina.1
MTSRIVRASGAGAQASQERRSRQPERQVATGKWREEGRAGDSGRARDVGERNHHPGHYRIVRDRLTSWKKRPTPGCCLCCICDTAVMLRRVAFEAAPFIEVFGS